MHHALRKVQGVSSSSQEKNQNVKNVPWQPKNAPVSSKEALTEEIYSLYWDGVRRELAQMILTLQEWQNPQFEHVKLEEEEKLQIEGFEHFVDQVSEGSRDFASKYAQERLQQMKAGKAAKTHIKTYEEAARDTLTAYLRRHEDHRLKSEIRGLVPDRRNKSSIERRARMLLQGAAFLDIDKVVMYNSPLPKVGYFQPQNVSFDLVGT